MPEPLKTILIFSDWYYPGFRAGGPVQSVYNLAILLSRHYNVKVITRNTDLNSTIPYPGLEPSLWHVLGEHHSVKYLDKTSVKTIKEIIKNESYDFLLINGLYSLYFSVLPAYYALIFKKFRTFIAVRGMLHKSALSVKPFKKQIFLAFARGFGLYKNFTLLSTNEKETIEIRRSLGNVHINLAPNIPLLPSDSRPPDFTFKKDGALRLLFLGRIAREKNPVILLEALQKIDFPCEVRFCGTTLDQSYFDVFMEKSKTLPAHVSFHYQAEIPHAQIGDLFDRADVMVMPSLGENFGHAIFESFVHSVPVIIGNNTPWKGIEEKSAGIEINPESPGELLAALQKFHQMDAEAYNLWRNGALELAKSYFKDNNFEEIYLKLFS